MFGLILAEPRKNRKVTRSGLHCCNRCDGCMFSCSHD